jgi:hypothetical protein
MIVDQEVTNQVVDMGLLTQTAEPARAILEVETIDVVADRGYFKIEDIEACEKAGMTPYVPKPQRGSSVSNGFFFRKDEFRYDAERDAFICPAGQVLSTRYESKLRELTKIDYSNRAACLVCAIKSRCTKEYRKVSRLENEAVLDRMAARLKARPDILDRRREIVEHPFGSIKQRMNQGAFLMRGLDNVRAEFSLTALVYNLRRALNILGVEAMRRPPGGDGRRDIGRTDPRGRRSRHHSRGILRQNAQTSLKRASASCYRSDGAVSTHGVIGAAAFRPRCMPPSLALWLIPRRTIVVNTLHWTSRSRRPLFVF